MVLQRIIQPAKVKETFFPLAKCHLILVKFPFWSTVLMQKPGFFPTHQKCSGLRFLKQYWINAEDHHSIPLYKQHTCRQYFFCRENMSLQAVKINQRPTKMPLTFRFAFCKLKPATTRTEPHTWRQLLPPPPDKTRSSPRYMCFARRTWCDGVPNHHATKRSAGFLLYTNQTAVDKPPHCAPELKKWWWLHKKMLRAMRCNKPKKRRFQRLHQFAASFIERDQFKNTIKKWGWTGYYFSPNIFLPALALQRQVHYQLQIKKMGIPNR